MWYYKSHTHGIYTSEDEFSVADRTCLSCGDCDEIIGNFDSFEDFLASFADEINYCNSGGYDLKSIIDYCNAKITYDDALKIVSDNRSDRYIDRFKFMKYMLSNVCPVHCEGCVFNKYKSCLLENALGEFVKDKC